MNSYLSAIDDAVCQYQNDTLKASALMTLISQQSHL